MPAEGEAAAVIKSTVAAATIGLWCLPHRASRTSAGSRQAETVSSAIHRSTSSASALGEP